MHLSGIKKSDKIFPDFHFKITHKYRISYTPMALIMSKL